MTVDTTAALLIRGRGGGGEVRTRIGEVWDSLSHAELHVWFCMTLWEVLTIQQDEPYDLAK